MAYNPPEAEEKDKQEVAGGRHRPDELLRGPAPEPYTPAAGGSAVSARRELRGRALQYNSDEDFRQDAGYGPARPPDGPVAPMERRTVIRGQRPGDGGFGLPDMPASPPPVVCRRPADGRCGANGLPKFAARPTPRRRVYQNQRPPVYQNQGPPVYQDQGPPGYQNQGPPVVPPPYAPPADILRTGRADLPGGPAAGAGPAGPWYRPAPPPAGQAEMLASRPHLRRSRPVSHSRQPGRSACAICRFSATPKIPRPAG